MNGVKEGLRGCALGSVLLSAMLVGMVSDAGAWATITVNSLADPGEPGICALRDAITAANSKSATNGCAAGSGNDSIQFSVTGTIRLASTLPEVTDSQLTINGPASPGISISGGNAVGIMSVASATMLNLKNITIANGGNSNTDNVPLGGILNQGTLIVTQCMFSNNSGGFNELVPGGISNQGMLTIVSSVFSDNTGGAIENDGGTLTATGSTFSNNSSYGDGGLSNVRGTATVTTSTFLGNSGSAARSGAGGIGNSGTLTITDSTFSGNVGFAGGGIGNSGELTVTNSTFSDNSAFFAGGAIANGPLGPGSEGTITIINSTFAGNNGENSGGLGGGDIFGPASLRGTIVAGKTTDGNCGGFSGPAITDLAYNISDDQSCGFIAIGSLNNTDPMLDPAGLSNNGGPTQTIALVSESPAIDVIPVASCTDQDGNPLTTDQRGFPRPDAGEAVCDMGAYEFQDFGGDPGSTNCYGKSLFALCHTYRTLNAAATARGFRNVKMLQNAIQAFCKA